MRKLFSMFLLLLAFTFSVNAGDRDDKPSTKSIGLKIIRSDNSSTVHRGPMQVNVDVLYDSDSQTLTICYEGETSGEVFLYHGNDLIGYDSEINTSFQVSMTGLYKIEIQTESWNAEGYFEL